MISRRGFFRRTLGAVVVAPLAPSLWARWVMRLEAAARWRRMSKALTASMAGFFNPPAALAEQYRISRFDVLLGFSEMGRSTDWFEGDAG